jgi:acyl-coenzyme A thioesterase PaaI-like protein
MADGEIAATLIEALGEAAAREAGGPTRLVSVEIMMVSPGKGAAHARLIRKTKSLLFMEAELKSSAGERIAMAQGVYGLA